MVAAQAHQKGSRKSATNPSNMKTIQNIFFCIGAIVSVGQPRTNSQALPKLDAVCANLQAGEFAPQQEEPYSLNSDRKESSSIRLAAASQ